MSNKKRFIVRKFIMATSAVEAIKKDKKHAVDDVFVDTDWMVEYDKKDTMGFENPEKKE